MMQQLGKKQRATLFGDKFWRTVKRSYPCTVEFTRSKLLITVSHCNQLLWGYFERRFFSFVNNWNFWPIRIIYENIWYYNISGLRWYWNEIIIWSFWLFIFDFGICLYNVANQIAVQERYRVLIMNHMVVLCYKYVYSATHYETSTVVASHVYIFICPRPNIIICCESTTTPGCDIVYVQKLLVL